MSENIISVASALKTSDKVKKTLADHVKEHIDDYFMNLEGERPNELYKMVLEEVEKALFSAVLNQARGNQSETAKLLGVSRSTLRKKLALYGVLQERLYA